MRQHSIECREIICRQNCYPFTTMDGVHLPKHATTSFSPYPLPSVQAVALSNSHVRIIMCFYYFVRYHISLFASDILFILFFSLAVMLPNYWQCIVVSILLI